MLTERSLTTGERQGTGIFDELMRTVQSHVHNELADGRISEQAYATVYLGALQYTLQAANQYTLQYQTVNKNLTLLDEQILAAKKQSELLDLQKSQLTLANETAQYTLDTVMPEQHKQVQKQNLLLDEQVNQALAQITQITAQNSLVAKQEAMVDQQILSERDKTVDPTGGLNKVQYDKAHQEMELMQQKVVTEQSQTQDSVNGLTIGGLVGREINLKQNQADSFIRNAEVQAAKIMSDTYAVIYSTEPTDNLPASYGFSASNVTSMVDKLMAGVNTKG